MARQGADLAQQALQATEIRFSNGAATESELRDARAGALEASGLVQSAAAGVELAELALSNLVGPNRPPPSE